MGVAALSAIGALGTGFGVTSAIGGGFSANRAASAEANLQRQQGDILLAESKVNAGNEAYNQRQAIGKQRLAFLANGVSLEGSPAMVLKDSTEYGQQQVDAILRRGAAGYGLAYQEAALTKNKGRAALITGVGSGLSDLASGVSSMSRAGVFDPAKPVKKNTIGGG